MKQLPVQSGAERLDEVGIQVAEEGVAPIR